MGTDKTTSVWGAVVPSPPDNGTAGGSGRFNTRGFRGGSAFRTAENRRFLELMAQRGTATLGSPVMNASDATAYGLLLHG